MDNIKKLNIYRRLIVKNINFFLSSYQLNCMGGICFDTNGKILKRWFWPEDSKSIAFHPLSFTLNEYMSIQIHSRFKIILHFRTKVGCCRFSIGSKVIVNVKLKVTIVKYLVLKFIIQP